MFYANRNTREVVETDGRNARLDALDNWTSHESRESAEDAATPPAALVVHDGVLHRPGMTASPTLAPRGELGEAPPSSATTVKVAKPVKRDSDGQVDGGDNPASAENVAATGTPGGKDRDADTHRSPRRG